MSSSGKLVTSAAIVDGTITAADVQAGQLPVRLAQVVVSTPVTTISFTSISQAYSSLEVRIFGVSTGSGAAEEIRMRINGYAGTAYHHQALYATVSSAAGVYTLATTALPCGYAPGAGASPAGWVGGATVVIHGYTTAALFKSVQVLSHARWGTGSGDAQVRSDGGAYASAAAVTDLEFYTATGQWAAGSQISLYGWP